MVHHMPDAVARLGAFATLVEETAKLRAPYRAMITRLSESERITQMSSDALAILEKFFWDVFKSVPLYMYQLWALDGALTVGHLPGGYGADVSRVNSLLKEKRRGYERSIEAFEKMEAYMNGTTGRKSLDEGFRTPISADCLARLTSALPRLKSDKEAFYEDIEPYADFDEIMDSLDFLPIEEAEGLFAVTSVLKEAYNDRVATIERKERRYEAGVNLAFELYFMRPTLEAIEALYNPAVSRFIHQEYYRFWRDDTLGRSLLSHRKFTYTATIKRMRSNVSMLIPAIGSFLYFSQ